MLFLHGAISHAMYDFRLHILPRRHIEIEPQRLLPVKTDDSEPQY
jgi:hypothetical protein